MQYADGGTVGGRWPEIQPLSYNSALLADATALLTGRNHHTVGMGGITEIATGSPGYNSVLPNTCAPIARTLKLNGYATAQFGKCHEVPVWETSPAGPFDAWPTGGGGFEYFTVFSAARRTNGIHRSMKAPHRSRLSTHPKRATT
jgi:arylsulfatase A-like enzyme